MAAQQGIVGYLCPGLCAGMQFVVERLQGIEPTINVTYPYDHTMNGTKMHFLHSE